MRGELRRYSSIGDRDGILLFCSKVLTGEWESIASIRISCSFIRGVNLNFNCALMVFEDLGIIKIQDDKCLSSDLIYNEEAKDSFIQLLCSKCLSYLISEDLIDKSLLKFDENYDRFYIPTFAFRLDSAIIRNLLKELYALVLVGTSFYIEPGYEKLFNDCVEKKKKLSQKELLQKLEMEREMGEAGELFVMAFETKRLNPNITQKKFIKQISHIDVSAGYDIISLHNTSSLKRRYIEVKTYNGNIHFYWSANEINSSKVRGDDYFLYLVDYSKISLDNYSPIMIQNPNYELKNNVSWNAMVNSYYIEIKNSIVTEINDTINNYTIKKQIEIEKKDREENIEPSKTLIYKSYTPNCIPLYTLKAACGYFEENEKPDVESWIDVSGHGFTPDNNKYFAIHAKGNSMYPTISDGDICVFERYQAIPENGEIVLTEQEGVDPDYGCEYTIKKFFSEESTDSEQIIRKLMPLNPSYKTIILDKYKDYRIVGKLKFVMTL